MSLPTLFNSSDTASNRRRFVVNMLSKNGAQPTVRSCEITSALVRNRTSFPNNAAIHDIFIKGVAEALVDCIKRLSDTTEVISLPTFSLEVPGLVLAGAQLMTTKGDDGTLSIIFRFQLVMGGVNRAFRHDIGINDNLSDHSAELATNVLADIAMPLLDICAAAESGVLRAEDSLADFGNHLITHVHEIRFRIELMKRFVEQSDSKRGPDEFFDLSQAPSLR